MMNKNYKLFLNILFFWYLSKNEAGKDVSGHHLNEIFEQCFSIMHKYEYFLFLSLSKIRNNKSVVVSIYSVNVQKEIYTLTL